MPWTGPYVSHNWVNGDSGTAARLNNIESQYGLATATLEQDLVTGFVLYGLVASKDTSTSTQLDVTAGVALLLQTDSTVARQAIASSAGPLSTSGHPSTTLFLDLNPNGTYNFATSHSATAGHLTIASCTTDGSSNILTVTDARNLDPQIWPSKVNLATNPGQYSVPAPFGIENTQNPALVGTVAGGVTYGQGGPILNDYGTGALFNGTSGTISCAVSGLPTGNGAWTLEAWGSIPSIPSSSGNIIYMGNGVTHQAASLYVTSAGKLSLDTQGGSAALGNAALSTSTWHHLVGTYDGTTLTVYVDSVAQTATATPGSGSLTSTGLWIGSALGGSTWFNGSLARVAVYNTALSSTRITAHYNAGISQSTSGYDATVLADSPLRYHKLADAVGSLAAVDTITATTTQVIDGGGVIKSVGGQASTGILGVPVIVAQAQNVHVTVTTQQTILTYTPPITGTYRISGWFFQGNSANELIFFGITSYTDQWEGVAGYDFILPGGTTSLDGASTTVAHGSTWTIVAYQIPVVGGTAITIAYRDPAGSPNDRVTVIIERLT